MDYQSFHIDNEEFLDSLDPYLGELAAMQFCQRNISLKEFWTPLELSFFQTEGGKDTLPDIGFWKSSSLILSEKALVALHSYLIPHGEILPLTYYDQSYYVFNCLTDIEPDLSVSEGIFYDGHFCDVKSLVFKPDVKATLFKTSFENCKKLYCTGEFKSIVEKEKLGGIYFSEDLTAFM